MQPSGRFDRSFREALLAHLYRTPELSRFLREGATPQPEQADFEIETERALLLAAQEVVATSGLTEAGTVPYAAAGHVLSAMAASGALDPSLLRPTLELLLAIRARPVDDLAPAHFAQQMPLFLEEQRLIAIDRQGSVLAPQAHVEAIQHAVRSSALIGRRGQTFSLDAEPPPPVEPITSGFLSLDGPMGGGPARKETVLFCAGTGVGKTTFMLNVQRGAALMGYRVGLWTLELPMDQIRRRRDSLCSRVPYNLVNGRRNDGLSREEIRARVREGTLAWTGEDVLARMVYFDYSEEEATVEKIDADIRAEAEAGEPLDVILIDWLECIGLSPRQAGADKRQQIQQMPLKELRHLVEHIANKVTDLPKRHNVAGWVTTQTNFQVQNKSTVRMADKAETKGASRKMSWFLGAGMSPEDEEAGVINITADKTREGRFFQCQLRRRLDEQRFEDVEAQLENSTQFNN